MDEAAYQSLRDIDAVLFLISGNEKKGLATSSSWIS